MMSDGLGVGHLMAFYIFRSLIGTNSNKSKDWMETWLTFGQVLL